MHVDVAIVAYRKVSLAPPANLVQFSGVGDAPGVPEAPGSIQAAGWDAHGFMIQIFSRVSPTI
jgi:hypothetical protein